VTIGAIKIVAAEVLLTVDPSPEIVYYRCLLAMSGRRDRDPAAAKWVDLLRPID